MHRFIFKSFILTLAVAWKGKLAGPDSAVP